MSLSVKNGLIARLRRGKQARARMVESNLSEGIAFQIRATRDAQGLSQQDLADLTGMGQNNISRLESPDYGKHSVTSLKRIADALDVALVVRFVPFTQYVDWLSGTPFTDEGLSAESLTVPSFTQLEEQNRFASPSSGAEWTTRGQLIAMNGGKGNPILAKPVEVKSTVNGVLGQVPTDNELRAS
jgi:transcriptional regulator with XRE-family HTH domain